jgi:uroporphyrinogen decarboxylase
VSGKQRIEPSAPDSHRVQRLESKIIVQQAQIQGQMHMKPSFQNILNTLQRNESSKDIIPHYEHFVDDEIIESIMDFDFSKITAGTTTFSDEYVQADDLDIQIDYWKHKLQFYMDLGYDFLPVEFPPLFPQTKRLSTADTAVHNRGQREWINEHDGFIKSVADLHNEDHWPDQDHIFNYHLMESIAQLIPDNIKIIGGIAGGPMEHGMYLLGMEDFFIKIATDIDFMDALYKKLFDVFVEITERLIKIDAIGVFRIGDDLGYYSGTLISLYHLRRYIFPIYKKIVEICHAHNKPFILHSCGNLEEVMADLVDDCKIDAKHSFEDKIMPVTEAYQKWGQKVALLGGVDMDFLASQSPAKIKDRTKQIMDVCSVHGGFAIGSGNTIANYIPVENYLAMMEAANEFNG